MSDIKGQVGKLEMQLMLKIINCIRFHLCKVDEDYDRPVISPKFLSDTLDQMAIDGFEGCSSELEDIVADHYKEYED